MDRFWIDANVFIQAANGLLAFDLAPGFWESLGEHVKEGSIKSSIIVYSEIVPPKKEEYDDLSFWSLKMFDAGLFVTPDEKAVSEYQPIADHVQTLDRAEAQLFLKGADGWLIAHAKVEGSFVVTEEKLVTNQSKKIKIPNICERFGVRYINTVEMMRRLGISLRK